MGDWADSLTPEQADAIFGLKDLPSGLSDINTAVDNTAANLIKAAAVPAAVVAVKSTDEAVKEIQKRTQETKESFVHPQWKVLLSEEIGQEFDAFAKEYGDEVAVYAMFEWYNRWIREHTIVLEGFEHLQEHKLVENIESLLKEAPGDEEQASLIPPAGTTQKPMPPAGAGVQDTGKEKGGIVRGIGKAFRKATGAIGKGVGAAVGGAVNVLVKPILNSAPVKGFLNKIEQALGMQGPIDPAKLQADYEGDGSPTDSDAVGKFLIKNAGATKSEVDAAFKGAGVDAQAPEETPDDEPTPPEGGDTPPKGPVSYTHLTLPTKRIV